VSITNGRTTGRVGSCHTFARDDRSPQRKTRFRRLTRPYRARSARRWFRAKGFERWTILRHFVVLRSKRGCLLIRPILIIEAHRRHIV
jgi:hypothetical protein